MSFPARMLPPRAGPLVFFHGRNIKRRVGFLLGAKPTCPAGHRVDQRAKFLEDGTLYCDHRTGQGQTPCGAVLYVLVFPARGIKKRIFLADCTRDEMQEIERLGLDADGVLDYFGATFAP
jgi:hypothetical protein